MAKKKAVKEKKPKAAEWLPCGCRREGKKLVRTCPEHSK